VTSFWRRLQQRPFAGLKRCIVLSPLVTAAISRHDPVRCFTPRRANSCLPHLSALTVLAVHSCPCAVRLFSWLPWVICLPSAASSFILSADLRRVVTFRAQLYRASSRLVLVPGGTTGNCLAHSTFCCFLVTFCEAFSVSDHVIHLPDNRADFRMFAFSLNSVCFVLQVPLTLWHLHIHYFIYLYCSYTHTHTHTHTKKGM
jgi:hypothetical protein